MPLSEDIIKLLKSRLVALATKRLLALLVAKLPFMSFGPFSWVAGYFIGKILNAAVEYTSIGAALIYIEFDTNRQVRTVKRVINQIKEADEKDLEERADQYEAKLVNAYAKLIKF